MAWKFAIVVVTLASLVPLAGAASELRPMEGGTFVLGDQSASIYYTSDGDTFEVVTTIGPSNGSGAPVRLVGFLQPGQKQIVSVGTYGTIASPQELVVAHQGDVLSIMRTAETVARK
jgi:hypothetical protein